MIAAVAAFVAAWETVAYAWDKPEFFPSLTALPGIFIELSKTDGLADRIGFSLNTFVLGYMAAATVGIGVGGMLRATGWKFFTPWVSGLAAVPFVTIAPIFLLAFGFSVLTPTAIVFSFAVFPMMDATVTDLTLLERDVGSRSRSEAAPAAATLTEFTAGSAYLTALAIAQALRIGLLLAVIGLFFAEFSFGESGIGHLIALSTAEFSFGPLWAIFLSIAVAMILMNSLLRGIERRLVRSMIRDADEVGVLREQFGRAADSSAGDGLRPAPSLSRIRHQRRRLLVHYTYYYCRSLRGSRGDSMTGDMIQSRTSRSRS